MDVCSLFERYVAEEDWQVRENSNMSYSLQGWHNRIVGEASKELWRQYYPESAMQAHDSGDIHIHDLSSLACYCAGWSLEDIIQNGFKGVPGKMESKPPKHFRTALGQIYNFIYTLQGETAGAQALSNVDTLLAPFIRYDCLSYTEVKQSIQEMVFNLNVPTRVGFQCPFSNFTLDLVCPSVYENEPVIVSGVND
jgi:ribonucleoside-triphosphate reductase (formate)